MKKISKSHKPYWEMTAAELAEATKEFDGPIDFEKDTRPLTAKERAKFERMVADKPDVSIHVSAGRRDYIIHLDDDLLAKAAKFARKNKTTLPKMIDRGLRELLSVGK